MPLVPARGRSIATNTLNRFGFAGVQCCLHTLFARALTGSHHQLPIEQQVCIVSRTQFLVHCCAARYQTCSPSPPVGWILSVSNLLLDALEQSAKLDSMLSYRVIYYALEQPRVAVDATSLSYTCVRINADHISSKRCRWPRSHRNSNTTSCCIAK